VSEEINYLVELSERPPVKARSDAKPLPTQGVVASARKHVIESNLDLPEAKRIPIEVVDEIVSREQGKNEFSIIRSVQNYVSTIENPDTPTPTIHRDLLPKSHPLSTKWVSSFHARRLTAEFFATDMRIKDPQTRAMVASAIATEPESTKRKFFTEAIMTSPENLELLAVIEQADQTILKKTSK
jgi:hypothetical protein